MPRWESDGKRRLEHAALDLFLEAGYDSTTVDAIAKRAGLTERSFYRYFTDKREALFSGAETLTDHLVARVAAAPPGASAHAALTSALATADKVFLPRDEVRRRAEAITRSPALAERELIKLTQLTDALVAALVSRGVVEREARLLADLGMSVFRVASEDWFRTGRPFPELLAEGLEEQRRLVAGVGPEPGRPPG